MCYDKSGGRNNVEQLLFIIRVLEQCRTVVVHKQVSKQHRTGVIQNQGLKQCRTGVVHNQGVGTM